MTIAGAVTTIALNGFRFSVFQENCETVFTDETFVFAAPCGDKGHRLMAEGLGYGKNIFLMCIERQFFHNFLIRYNHWLSSPLLWAIAHNKPESLFPDEHIVETYALMMMGGDYSEGLKKFTKNKAKSPVLAAARMAEDAIVLALQRFVNTGNKRDFFLNRFEKKYNVTVERIVEDYLAVLGEHWKW